MSREDRVESRLAWYWHRLRAMDPAEVAGHLERKWWQLRGNRTARQLSALTSELRGLGYPRLPDRQSAPAPTALAAARHLDNVFAGRWRPFHGLELTLDDPPRWQKDLLASIDLETRERGHLLDPRRPPGSGDARMIWELSRWDPLIQAAQGAWLLGRDAAAMRSLSWLEDWARANPPYRGWNWTSALESGIRLIQLAWIDALLGAVLGDAERATRLVPVIGKLVPAHAWFTWHHRSFGSSANNHLLGELAGLIVATTRWSAVVATTHTSLDVLQTAWEREVMAQFAEDGGNREQALHYHLFALELCLQSTAALAAAGRAIAPATRTRLERAAAFYATAQVASDPWDYGDSDDAFVTRFHAESDDPRPEWRSWLAAEPGGEAIAFWLGPSPLSCAARYPGNGDEWARFPDTGIAVCRADGWSARFDASPLGYLSTAAHGHLDALHLSLWLDGQAIVVDPGTGTYYADPCLRELLASRRFHNGPCPIGLDRPRRRGSFLWSEHHPKPSLVDAADGSIEASLATPQGKLRRSVRFLDGARSCLVADQAERGIDFWVRWQLAPASVVEPAGERAWRITRGDALVTLEAAGPWAETAVGSGPVSPSFRVVVEAPFVALRAGAAADSGELRTLFRRGW